jgi:hypothetical protein
MPGSTTRDRDEVLDAVAAARAASTEYQERVAELKQALRSSQHPGLAFERRRIEAYAALVGCDEGMAMSMAGWLDEIAEAAKGASA